MCACAWHMYKCISFCVCYTSQIVTLLTYSYIMRKYIYTYIEHIHNTCIYTCRYIVHIYSTVYIAMCDMYGIVHLYCYGIVNWAWISSVNHTCMQMYVYCLAHVLDACILNIAYTMYLQSFHSSSLLFCTYTSSSPT